MRSRSLGSIFILALLTSSGAAAEESPACAFGTPETWSAISDTYVGPWQISHHSGFYIAGGMTQPFPASGAAETIQLTQNSSGAFTATHPEMQQPMVFEWADEPPWTFEGEAKEDGVPEPLLSSSDIELVLGCGVEDVARLIGRTEVTIDGVTMKMTLRLMVTGGDHMYGIFHTSAVARGIPVTSWRAVTLTR